MQDPFPTTPSPAVLVVDDSKVSRNMVMGLLKRRLPELDFLEAGDGETAVQLARGRRLELVVMDFNMPGMHGVDAALAIRALHPAVPVVLLTANAQSAVQAKAEAAGLHLMRKPIKPELADQIAALAAQPA